MEEVMSEQPEAGKIPAETKHEPHKHAKPRVLWGVAAVVVVLAGVLIWARWGSAIKEACLGENGTCTIDMQAIPQGGAQFDPPEDF
jgi:hypothetical protein